MTTLREAATQALEALEDFGMKSYENTGDVLHRDVYESLKSALAEEALQTCNCRWDGEVQVQQCTLHEAHVDAIHEWAERAKTAEKKLAALAEPVQEPGDFDHAIGADRFKVVRGAFWWHVLIGDSPTEHGKFRSRASAEKMAADLLREFRNGAFVQHEATQTTDKCHRCKTHVPLTEEKIEKLLIESAGMTVQFSDVDLRLARAIERAHGIGS